MTEEATTPSRLQAARAAIDEQHACLAAISQRMRELDQAAQRRRADADKAQAPRQEKRGLLATILRRGGEADREEAVRLKEIDKQIAAAQAAGATAADELQVIADLQAELQREADEVHATTAPLQRELAEAQYLAARDEIQQQALPEFLQAAEAFRQAYAQVVGAGKAHCAMGDRLIQRYGVLPAGTVGSPRPDSEPRLALVGFPIEELLRGHPTLSGLNSTLLRLPAGDLIDQVAATTMTRWEAARA